MDLGPTDWGRSFVPFVPTALSKKDKVKYRRFLNRSLERKKAYLDAGGNVFKKPREAQIKQQDYRDLDI